MQYRIHESNFSGNLAVTEREAAEIAADALAHSSIPKEDCMLLLRAYRKELAMPGEIESLGQVLLRRYRQCKLRMDDVAARELLEQIFYGFLLDYTCQGWTLYWHAAKTGIFRWNSIWGLKLLIESLIKWRRSV